MIKALHLHKKFGTLEVLKGVSLTINKGEIVAIVGASGAGKTTLLQILGTLDTPEKNPQSSLYINDTDVLKLKEKEQAVFRNKNLGFIFRSEEHTSELQSRPHLVCRLLL